MDLKSNFLIIGSLMISIFLLSACSNVEKVQHIEVFVTETSEQNDEGFFETTGYKKVNSITSIEEGKNHIKTDIKAIEDFYDTEGNYLRTEIIHSSFNKSNVTQAEDGENRKEELQEPSTVLIPNENIEQFKLDNVSKEDKEKVKEHVLSFMDRL
ncbi:hypothetical protein [Schinkia azotoformans]|uniref:hypothetical protein n=1 Tax=Schinkia azotoformans TaxID=1454 RepID=UPI002DBD6584|nr:hypothetical protein [Schinkia azotoformans]MEC1716266.1 hypothetical protein [Schinkia azotoformans]MEC1741643.1 hypothetical protein [Schinkia azotoformans]MEC1745665.1 hypothetical protein [Schinkia azotoformans]MEC1766863.1 hypothetical protein [Schinkia azotoformans]MEC1787658.1 hypothetical protein [Schinkia azotoformans]